MAFIPPPRALTKEEFIKEGYTDKKFNRWYRYESNPFGWILWILDKIRNKECKDYFKENNNVR